MQSHVALPAVARLLWALVALAPSTSAGRQRVYISPKLDPTSDRVFFKKDYPDDLNPEGQQKVKFRHPYPAVQEHDRYDRDYVKDDNGDDGRWRAQMEYDLVRTKISQRRDDYKKAKETEEQLRHELDEAKSREAAAAQAAKDAEARAEEAHAKSVAAKGKAKQAAEEAQVASGDAAKRHKEVAERKEKEVEEAVGDVKQQMEDLKDCQKKLADARARLKQLVQQRDQDSSSNNTLESAGSSKEEAAANATAVAELEVKKAEAEVAKKLAEDARLKREIAEEEAKHEEASHVYEKEAADMEDLEHDMDAASRRLRKYHKDWEAEGAEVHARSAASSYRPCSLLVAAVVGVWLARWSR